MIFWLFSGLAQKSGALTSSSSLTSWDRRLGASKIAPHSVSLLAERGVFAFEFVEGHSVIHCSSRDFVAATFSSKTRQSPNGIKIANETRSIRHLVLGPSPDVHTGIFTPGWKLMMAARLWRRNSGEK
jgi:hypothetical protein